MRLTNTTEQPMVFESGHRIEPYSYIDVSTSASARILKHRYALNMERVGRLVVSPTPEPGPEPLTRATIAKAKRAELVDILTMHGIAESDLEGVYVEDTEEGGEGLRTMAARVVLADL